jgi:hypothetical protein
VSLVIIHIHNKTAGNRMGVIVNNTLESIYVVGQEETQKNFAGSPQPRFGCRTFQIGCRSATHLNTIFDYF